MATHGDIYLQSDKIIDHIPDSAEVKSRCSLHMWVEIETQKDVIHCPTGNIAFVCCVAVYFIVMLIF